MDTTFWGEAFWSEIDAVQVVGERASEALTSDVKRQPWETDLGYQVGHMMGGHGSHDGRATGHMMCGHGHMTGGLRSHDVQPCSVMAPRLVTAPVSSQARARFVAEWRRTHGAATTEEEVMRHAALSMVYSNNRFLGCRYPEIIEKAVGCARQGVTGMSVEGELRAAGAAAGR